MTTPTSRLWEAKLPASVISVAATPAMSLIVAGCVDRRGYAFDQAGTLLWAHETDHEVWAVACSRDGNFVALGTAEKRPARGSIHILNRAGSTVETFAIGVPVWSLDFDQTGTRLSAGTWGGDCIQYKLDRTWKEERRRHLDGAGVYGVRWRGRHEIAAVSYGQGLSVLSADGDTCVFHPSDLLGYNLAVDSRGGMYAGARSGHVVSIQAGEVLEHQVPSATRPIAGVATTIDGSVVFTGSFDGYLRATFNNGSLLWEFDLIGEVWSIASSPTGRFVVAGCGDGKVVVIDNSVTVEEAAEISSHLATLTQGHAVGDTTDAHKKFLDLLARLGLFGFGLRFLVAARERGTVDQTLYGELVDYLGELCPSDSPDVGELCFERANLRRARLHHWDAAVMYLRATRDKRLRLKAFSEAATEFYREQHHAAALACFRRAREAILASDDLKIIYTLARSFEDHGEKRIARDHLDMILVEDTDYRDAASRLTGVSGSTGYDKNTRVDYTGITVNLLGPDAPTGDVDPRLRHIVAARARELSASVVDRKKYNDVIHELHEKGVLAARTTGDSVDYDANAYRKYDSLLPQDDVKKKLEAINLIALAKRVPSLQRSLDIGTATGRYPAMLRSLDVEAFGIDVSSVAIEYAKSKCENLDADFLSVGDARDIQFPDEHFDLVTCMMGTFFHIPLAEQPQALKEMKRVCRPGGMVAISTWDIECPHLTFLSMYSVDEMELMVENARTANEMEKLLADAGLVEVGIMRFALVPDTISYDLGIQDLDAVGLSRLLEIDIAARASTPSKQGQMFIAFGVVDSK